MNRLNGLAWTSFAAALLTLGVALFQRAPTPMMGVSAADGEPREIPLSLTSDPSRFDLGEVLVGAHTNLVATITNCGDRPATLVGLPSFCENVGCVNAAADFTTIQPGSTGQVTLQFDPKRAGAANFKIRMFFAVGDQVGIVVPIALTATVIDR